MTLKKEKPKVKQTPKIHQKSEDTLLHKSKGR